MNRSKELKIGIIGTGGMAHWHAKSFLNIDNVKLVAFCDIDEEKVKKIFRKIWSW